MSIVTLAIVSGMIASTFVIGGTHSYSESHKDNFQVEDDPKRVAILYFDNTSGESKMEKLKKGLADMLITDLSNVSTLRIVERDKLEELIKEQKLSNSKGFDAKTASKLGKLLGAQIILTGSFFEMFGTFRIDARFIDVETGEILKSDGVEGPTANFFKLEKQLAFKIIENLEVNLKPEERVLINNSEKNQEISYQAALIYSQALELLDEGKRQRALEKLNVVLLNNPAFEPAMTILNKTKVETTSNETTADEKIYRGSGDPLKGLNVAKAEEMKIGNYYALIIGIDNYQGEWTPLKNAVNDAKAIEQLLRTNYRFDKFYTLYDENANRSAIFNQLEWLVENVEENDNVFIYYSGHGEFKTNLNKGYWVPHDASTKATSGYISNDDIQTFLAGIKSKHTLLVSDACFSGDIFRGSTVSVPFEDSEAYYKKVYSVMSRKAMTSGGIEPVMDGGKDGHSVFAYYFMKALTNNKINYLDASQLYNALRIPVMNNSEQSPMFQPIKNTGDEGGQFIFIKK